MAFQAIQYIENTSVQTIENIWLNCIGNQLIQAISTHCILIIFCRDEDFKKSKIKSVSIFDNFTLKINKSVKRRKCYSDCFLYQLISIVSQPFNDIKNNAAFPHRINLHTLETAK